VTKNRFSGPRENEGLARRAWLFNVAALLFACSVYGPSDLPVAPKDDGTGGGRLPQAGATAGDSPSGGSVHGGAAGTTGDGGAPPAGMSGKSGANNGGNVSPDAGAGGESGEGGAISGTPSGGKPSGGSASGGSASGGSHAGAGGASAGSTTGGSTTGGVPAILGLVASYPCESANGAVLADVSGQGKHASLANGSGGSPAGFAFSTGRVGNALTLSSASRAYVSLPQGIAAKLSAMTIATWVKLKSGAAFQRIFDLGVDTGTFMYLVNAGTSGFVRFRIVSDPLNKNQVLEGAEALPVGKWTHVAVTVGDNGVSIYVDGAQVAQQAPAALRPSDLGTTVNNFIGRSPFPDDPYLDGQIDELRIYNRVLTTAEIGSLAKGN
jgi:hypothetical protein